MTENDTRTLLGRPIAGDYTAPGRKPREQKPPSDLIDAIDAVLALDGVTAVRWEQYTPYFNDGDECVFSASEENELELDGEWVQDYNLYTYGRNPDGSQNWRGPRIEEYQGRGTSEILQAMKELGNALAGGAHDILLREKFGDHAQVTATAEGFDVEFYEHD